MLKKKYKITNKTGLHARPAAQIVNKANNFNSEMILTYRDRSINLKSVLGVLSLGVGKDSEVIFTAVGSDEEEAMKGVDEIIKNGLGEPI